MPRNSGFFWGRGRPHEKREGVGKGRHMQIAFWDLSGSSRLWFIV